MRFVQALQLRLPTFHQQHLAAIISSFSYQASFGCSACSAQFLLIPADYSNDLLPLLPAAASNCCIFWFNKAMTSCLVCLYWQQQVSRHFWLAHKNNLLVFLPAVASSRQFQLTTAMT